MHGTHILVLGLQLIILNLFRDYEKLRFRPFPRPCVYLRLQARLLAGRCGFEEKIRAQFYAVVKQIEPFHRVVTD